MFKNNLKIAWRHLVKDRQFTFLNVLGLSAGLACTLLIWLWVNDELSFDKFFEKDSQLYQLMENRTTAGLAGTSDESSGLLGETLKVRMPERCTGLGENMEQYRPSQFCIAEERYKHRCL